MFENVKNCNLIWPSIPELAACLIKDNSYRCLYILFWSLLLKIIHVFFSEFPSNSRYISKKVPVGVKYLEACIQQTKVLPKNGRLNRDLILKMLEEKIQSIDWEEAKKDIFPFIADSEKIKIWSTQFFLDLIKHLVVND